ETLAEARRKTEAKIEAFTSRSSPRPVHRDFVAQNRIYGYELAANVATERVTGFEVKENVSIRCHTQAEVDALIESAAKNGIYDLIKVDYVVTDLQAAR